MTVPPAGPFPEPAAAAGAGEAATAEPRALPWWAEPERVEPTEADLYGCAPDLLAGPPDGAEDDWLAGLCEEQLSAVAELDLAAFAARGGRPGGQGPIPAGFTHRDGADPDPEPGERPTGPGTGFEAGGLLDAAAPGPVLAGFTADAFAGLGGLSDDELVGMLLASRRLAAWQDGIELAAVAELDRRRHAAAKPGSSAAGEHVSEELAAALVLTGRGADWLVGLSRALERLPMVAAALLAGQIDQARAVIFAEELAGLPDLAAQAIAEALIGRAGQLTTSQLRVALRRMVLRADPQAVRKRAERAAGQARVESWAEGSGNAALAGRELPPAEVIAADERISAIARALKQAGAPGRLSQLRAQVFLALLNGRDPATIIHATTQPAGGSGGGSGQGRAGGGQGAGAAGGGGDAGGPGTAKTGVNGSGSTGAGDAGGTRPGLGALAGSVNLTMPLSAWLKLTDWPGEVAGLGPVGSATCRDLAGRVAAGPRGKWCVTLTDSRGRAVGHACASAGPGPPGRWPVRWLRQLRFEWLESGTCAHQRQSVSYQPPGTLRHLINVRHRTCAFPGCRAQAVHCDLDHTVPFGQGGLTCECNLASLCRRHHRAKQADGWHLAQPEPGVLAWTLPHGRSYQVTPDPYPI